MWLRYYMDVHVPAAISEALSAKCVRPDEAADQVMYLPLA